MLPSKRPLHTLRNKVPLYPEVFWESNGQDLLSPEVVFERLNLNMVEMIRYEAGRGQDLARFQQLGSPCSAGHNNAERVPMSSIRQAQRCQL
jgi:hypothetical protein